MTVRFRPFGLISTKIHLWSEYDKQTWGCRKASRDREPKVLAHIHLPYSLFRRLPTGLLQDAGESLDGLLGLDDGAALTLAELLEHRVDAHAEHPAIRVGDKLRLDEGVIPERDAEVDVVVQSAGDRQQDVKEGVDQVEDGRHLRHEAILAVHDMETAECIELLAELATDPGEGVGLFLLVEPAGAGVAAGGGVVEQHGVQMDGDFGAVDVLQLEHHSGRHGALSPRLWRGCHSPSERVFSYTHKMRCCHIIVIVAATHLVFFCLSKCFGNANTLVSTQQDYLSINGIKCQYGDPIGNIRI